MTDEDLLDIHAVATRLGVAPRTVKRLVARGELAAIRLSSRTTRYSPADVDAFIEARKAGAAS